MKKPPIAQNVDRYIAAAPKKAQARLKQLREIVKATAPEAIECIAYGMPYYKDGAMIASFGAYKNHIGFYGTMPEDIRHAFERQDFKTNKGTVRFPLDKSLPVALIKKLVKSRVAKGKSKAK